MKIKFSHNDIEKFISGLENTTIAKVLRSFDLLEKFGHELRMPHVKKINRELFELRVRGNQEVRFLFFFYKNQIIVVLNGFIKKKQKISFKHIKLAEQRKNKIVDKDS